MKQPIRWTGSKKRLLRYLRPKVPKKFNTYYELFIGAGSLFFDLEHSPSVINDTNPELINFYEVLKSSCDDLINSVCSFKSTEENYYQIREWDRQPDWKNRSSLDRAARFLYLNRNCFNGVWRQNPKTGFHNVPWGHLSKNPDYRIETLKKSSFLLQNTTIACQDFQAFESQISKGDFVYLDPPFARNSNNGLTHYGISDFTEKDQERLVFFCKSIHSKEATFLLSNSFSEEIVSMYDDFNIEIVDVKRVVGQPHSRRMVQEVLITNTI